MPRRELRVYHEPDLDDLGEIDRALEDAGPVPRELVEVSLHDVVTVLADAIQTNRGWLSDFDDERVTISRDLFEVLQVYQQLRRAAA